MHIYHQGEPPSPPGPPRPHEPPGPPGPIRIVTWSSIYRVSQKTHFKNCHELASDSQRPIDVVAGS